MFVVSLKTVAKSQNSWKSVWRFTYVVYVDCCAILRCAAIALVQRTLKLESSATPRWESERHVFGNTVAVSTG